MHLCPVPCVVGDSSKPHNFLVAALTSLFVRNLAVLFTALYNFPPFLMTRTTLMFCNSEDFLTKFNMTPICHGFDCLDICSTESTFEDGEDCFTQRFRQCANEEDS